MKNFEIIGNKLFTIYRRQTPLQPMPIILYICFLTKTQTSNYQNTNTMCLHPVSFWYDNDDDYLLNLKNIRKLTMLRGMEKT